MKKLLSAAIVIVLVALLATPALAHGGHHSRSQRVSYSVCATESCTLTGLHYHNGRTYSEHYYGDGHNYHAYCPIEDCALIGYHSHDGTYCFGHTVNDGHDYHDYCDYAYCGMTGYHEHYGTYHFEHSFNDGHTYHRTSRGHH